MTLILSGTDGLSDVDGSAATPAIRGTDANTGIFFPAADTIAFSEGGVESMRIDSSGNVGIGTSSPGTRLQLGNNSNASELARFANTIANFDVGVTAGGCQLYTANNQPIVFSNNAAERMRIDTSGNVGIGTASPSIKLDIVGSAAQITNGTGASGSRVRFDTPASSGGSYMQLYKDLTPSYVAGIGTALPGGSAASAMIFSDYQGSWIERMRIDSSGNLLVGTTSTSQNSGVGTKILGGNVSVVNTGSNDGFDYYNTTAGAFRFYVQATGQIAATITTIAGISDQRLKENIRDLDDGLASIMALQPRKFDWKEGKGADTKNARGFIAQEFETVFPDLIDEWKDPSPEGEDPYKSVRADLIPVLVKAIQEMKAIIDTQASTITTLTDRITALETPTGTQA